MKGLIQRVSRASVSVEQQTVGEIDQGILLLLGVEKGDDEAKANKLLHRVSQYRIFADSEAKMNRSLVDVAGGLLVVSQFTLAADTGKGLRPSFSSAAPAQLGQQLYDYFLQQARLQLPKVANGIFAADMQVSLVNDGPVTFLIEV